MNRKLEDILDVIKENPEESERKVRNRLQVLAMFYPSQYSALRKLTGISLTKDELKEGVKRAFKDEFGTPTQFENLANTVFSYDLGLDESFVTKFIRPNLSNCRHAYSDEVITVAKVYSALHMDMSKLDFYFEVKLLHDTDFPSILKSKIELTGYRPSFLDKNETMNKLYQKLSWERKLELSKLSSHKPEISLEEQETAAAKLLKTGKSLDAFIELTNFDLKDEFIDTVYLSCDYLTQIANVYNCSKKLPKNINDLLKTKEILIKENISLSFNPQKLRPLLINTDIDVGLVIQGESSYFKQVFTNAIYRLMGKHIVLYDDELLVSSLKEGDEVNVDDELEIITKLHDHFECDSHQIKAYDSLFENNFDLYQKVISITSYELSIDDKKEKFRNYFDNSDWENLSKLDIDYHTQMKTSDYVKLANEFFKD